MVLRMSKCLKNPCSKVGSFTEGINMELNVQKPIRKYEAIIIFNPDVTEEQQKAFFQKQKDILKSYRGEFLNLDTWGKRRLGNPIDKFTMGTYFHAMFEADGECVAELERTMRIDDKILRYMNSRLDDRKTLAKHLEDYREVLKLTAEREKEKAAAKAKRQSRR